MKLLLIALLLVLGCKSHKHRSNKTFNEAVAERYTLYHELSPTGFIGVDECDALLFSALLAVAKDVPFNIEEARDDSGQWFRRPSMDCWNDGGAKSTISRDMFMGLFLYTLHFERGDIAKQIWQYGTSHNWSMGQADTPVIAAARTLFTPATISLLAQIRYKLTGRDAFIRHIVSVYSTVPGYRSHLSMLSIYMAGRIAGSITSLQLETLKEIKRVHPTNALAEALVARYTDGNFTRASALLLRLYPHDRLPTSSDWCSQWVNQRVTPSPPCDEGKTHSGGDFLFVAAIILNKI